MATTIFRASFPSQFQMSSGPRLGVRVLPHGEGLLLPSYAHPGDSGFDLRAAIPPSETLILEPGERRLIPCGISLKIPTGCEIQVRPRSGLALRSGIEVVNAPGTVDSGYTGEIGVILKNGDHERWFVVERGDRIAQAVLAPVAQARLVEVRAHRATARGARGYGSSSEAE